MATTTTTPFFDNTDALGGVYPSDSRTGGYVSAVADEEGLDVINNIVKCISVAVGTRPLVIEVELGDHDAHATPLASHSIIYNDGTTSHEVAKAATTGRAGGVMRIGDGTAPDRLPIAPLTAKGWIGVKTIAAPATLQTASRYVRVAVILEAAC